MSLTTGTRLGQYKITGVLGAGGMGEVFRARDTRLGREVAIKVLPAEVEHNPERLSRFEREARVLASLNHPNIAHVYGFENTTLDDGSQVHYIAMEMVEGEDLSQRLKRGRMPIDESIAIARQIAEGLEEAHEHGIVHRDLKPANVKVTPDGKTKVLDFGIAKTLATDAAKASAAGSDDRTATIQGTEAGRILGTVAYMSPEQARGKAVDRRTDVWSFGALLFEMLSGKLLFPGETVSDILAAVLTREPDWTTLPASTPASVVRLLHRCLDRDLRNRLQSIGEARIALERASSRDDGAASTHRNHKFIPIAILTVVAIAAVAVGLAARMGRPASAPGDGGLKVIPLTNTGNVIMAAISPDGRYLAYVEAEQGRSGLWLKQLSGGQTLRLLPDQTVSFWGLVFTPDGNNIVVGQKSPNEPDGSFYSISTLGGSPKRLLTNIDSQPEFSPDGKRFAFLRRTHPTPQEDSLMIANADGSNLTTLATFKLPEHVAAIFYGAPAWSPDGSTIVTAVGREGIQSSSAHARPDTHARLVRVSVEGGAVTTLTDPGWVAAAAAKFLPDGRSLLVIARAVDQPQTQIWAVSYPGGEARRVTSDLNDHRIISLTQDGRTLVSISGQVSANVWTLPLRGEGKPTRIRGSTTDGLNGLAFTPDGRVVYTSDVGDVSSLWIADADGAGRAPFLTGRAGEVLSAPTVTNDGVVYYVSRVGSGSEIRAAEKDGSSSRVVVRGAPYDGFAVSPDGSSIVYSVLAEGVQLFRVSSDGVSKRVSDTASFVPALDPKGTRVVFFFRDTVGRFRLGIRSVDGGPLLLDLPSPEPMWAYSRLALTHEGIYLTGMPGDRANVWLLPFWTADRRGGSHPSMTSRSSISPSLEMAQLSRWLVAQGRAMRS